MAHITSTSHNISAWNVGDHQESLHRPWVSTLHRSLRFFCQRMLKKDHNRVFVVYCPKNQRLRMDSITEDETQELELLKCFKKASWECDEERREVWIESTNEPLIVLICLDDSVFDFAIACVNETLNKMLIEQRRITVINVPY